MADLPVTAIDLIEQRSAVSKTRLRQLLTKLILLRQKEQGAVITPPLRLDAYVTRNRDCREAIAEDLLAIIEEAGGVGWTLPDIAAAVATLLNEMMLGDSAYHRTRQHVLDELGRIRERK